MKYSFKNDYAEGAHPRILEALIQSNLIQQNGYGLDEYSLNAENIIRQKINNPKSKVHFVSGGTQANLIVISAFLRPHESVVAAATGHIFTNESGAIEATGHKVHGIETSEGKIYPDDIQKIIDVHQNKPHQVKQKLVYISNSTEVGTIYSKKELIDLYQFCQERNLYLFVDGARLGHALTAENNDLTLEDFGKYTDAFYLGGTKNGALIGEAIIINNESLQEEFGFHLKQKGAMLAKGRLLGIQFQELLKDDLYFDLAKQANQQAMKIKDAFTQVGCKFLSETFTNQIFPILTDSQIEQLSINFDFYVWKKLDNEKSAIRLITSWATTNEIIEKFTTEIKNLK
ncbi:MULTISPECIES: low specificity L-threonine aldolase [unclassified Kaistella]|uniref:threonine aldolase family protein n=1 Tax=unclassified Kaistella TaxID=2762626 RepID=UPI0027354ED3|nr:MULTISPECIES: aminotransferase class I/II-fold pyridoxal phosphate-dependent enzyme [unclassified Kaistella]MDP2455009.1 aminotransferase class V-fold PLP-dependent enzyme [Kaistella sp. SH11-4b]MDP2456008.1 aminotransferase class V-fold PLP-dependent enzyme [Kaistella sp. SH40-3]MDP2460679.1 aminotransferase class V-fold PLP-dependent enzyme [Kaistella sp. SH19-2b]